MTGNEEAKNEFEEIRARRKQKEEEISDALNVSGPGWFTEWFDDDLFLLDFWDADDALNYLVGTYGVEDLGEHLTDDGQPVDPWDGKFGSWVSDWTVTTLGRETYCEKNGELHVVDAFKNKIDRLTRIWESGTHEKRNPPIYYVEWALSKKIEIPWLDYVVSKGFIKLQSANKPTESLETRERNTMLKIIVALAVGGYRYPARGSKTEMLADFQLNGTSVDEKTLTKYLEQAKPFLPTKPE